MRNNLNRFTLTKAEKNKIRLIIFFAVKDGETLYTAKTRPGADSGPDHELLIAKFRLKLKKVGKPLDHSDMT